MATKRYVLYCESEKQGQDLLKTFPQATRFDTWLQLVSEIQQPQWLAQLAKPVLVDKRMQKAAWGTSIPTLLPKIADGVKKPFQAKLDDLNE